MTTGRHNAIRHRWTAIPLAFALALTACATSGTGSDVGSGDGSVPIAPALVDGAWVFEVDRAWNGQEVSSPSDDLPEATYATVADGPTYAVTVSDGATHVSIGEPPLQGTQASSTDTRRTYDLEGTFAGGRFVSWTAGGTLQAELTIYGSGSPILKSERGPLVPAAP